MHSIVCRMYLHCRRFDPTQAAAAVARYRIDGGWTAPALPGRDYIQVPVVFLSAPNAGRETGYEFERTVRVPLHQSGTPVIPLRDAVGKTLINFKRLGTRPRTPQGHMVLSGLQHTEVLPDVRLLPALSHLALDCYIPRKNSLAVLVEYPRLSLVVLKWHPSHSNLYQMARTPHVYDVRFVIAMDDDYWGYWLTGTRGLPSRQFRGG
ncbi:hypothetical protein DFH08DRAFT_814046 [Mycena albidolilacea]|uniref:Uncharacterized protein n=1 Tax=Mycena albidolilacea TaxID=1033008 RepID=A0AAD6ZR35_9AGAR|nr:hypothetical protein DFH08DRAFT_814046 [Mycena albidolilacea]